MSTAIERITGFACEVDKEQWSELVKVADEVGVKLYERNYDKEYSFIAFESEGGHIIGWHSRPTQFEFIPCPDFLAKLKGEEKWEPKNGEEVECRDGLGADWFLAKFVGYDGKWAICRPEHHPLGHYTTHNDVNIRPLRPTITRAEAEQKLKELGVIARIVD